MTKVPAKCPTCNARTKSGSKCKAKVSCRKGNKTRCWQHTRAPVYLPNSFEDDEKSDSDSDEQYDSGYGSGSDTYANTGAPDSWPNKYSWPEGGKFPASPKYLPHSDSWLNDTNRIYSDVSCPAFGKEFGKKACRHAYKCTGSCETKEQFRNARGRKLLSAFNDNPLAMPYAQNRPSGYKRRTSNSQASPKHD